MPQIPAKEDWIGSALRQAQLQIGALAMQRGAPPPKPKPSCAYCGTSRGFDGSNSCLSCAAPGPVRRFSPREVVLKATREQENQQRQQDALFRNLFTFPSAIGRLY